MLSIASVEGGFNGSIGDHGTSFGPFQMHVGGALPSGLSGAKAQQWANSKAGIEYALGRIQSVAGGLHGTQAISAISSRFERPADVPGEIAKASGRYSQFTGGGLPQGSAASLPNAPASVSLPGAAPGGPNGAAMQMLAQSMAQSGNTSGIGLLELSLQRQQQQAAQQSFGQPTQLSPNGSLLVKGASAASSHDMAAVKLAEHFVGTPYEWGGANPKTGFDCSGLLQFVWGKNGVAIPRTTYDQFQTGQSVNVKNLRPGDAVFFKGSDAKVVGGQLLPGHVGMYIGNGKIIQAPHTGADVEITPLSAMPDFMGARRYG